MQYEVVNALFYSYYVQYIRVLECIDLFWLGIFIVNKKVVIEKYVFVFLIDLLLIYDSNFWNKGLILK